MVGRLQAKMLSQHFKHGFVRRTEGPIVHRNANSEANIKSVAQVDVTQVAPFEIWLKVGDGP